MCVFASTHSCDVTWRLVDVAFVFFTFEHNLNLPKKNPLKMFKATWAQKSNACASRAYTRWHNRILIKTRACTQLWLNFKVALYKSFTGQSISRTTRFHLGPVEFSVLFPHLPGHLPHHSCCCFRENDTIPNELIRKLSTSLRRSRFGFCSRQVQYIC